MVNLVFSTKIYFQEQTASQIDSLRENVMTKVKINDICEIVY